MNQEAEFEKEPICFCTKEVGTEHFYRTLTHETTRKWICKNAKDFRGTNWRKSIVLDVKGEKV